MRRENGGSERFKIFGNIFNIKCENFYYLYIVLSAIQIFRIIYMLLSFFNNNNISLLHYLNIISISVPGLYPH